MVYKTLITVDELVPHLVNPDWAIIDCRFSLDDTERGRRDYLQGHIPGAVYAHLNEDLSAPIISGVTGRHPLPTSEQLVQHFSNWGIDENVQVVAYDDWTPASGAVAARLWWSLRWLGHPAVAVLNGGWEAWQRAGMATRRGMETRQARIFNFQLRPELFASSEDVDRWRQDPTYVVFDSRAYERYRGENEIIDPVAGHIPGAKSAPYAENAASDGFVLPVEALQERFNNLLAGVAADHSVFYCGSGVSAAYNLLALAHAGLGDGHLYVGSWSEWITNPQRPVSLGSK